MGQGGHGDHARETPRSRLRLIGTVATVVVAVVAVSQIVELFINQILLPDLEELTWISDVILTAALLTTTVLLGRLRLARAAIVGLARERSTPSSVLGAVSEILFLDAQADLYVTCVVALVDTAQHTMTYANAGHPAGILLNDRSPVRALGVGGPPLGLFPAARYDEKLVTLKPGDLVVLMSDGITDAINASGDGTPMAIAAQLAHLREKTPAAAGAALLERARRAPGPLGVMGWADDRTVLVFAVSPDSSAAM